MRSIKTQAVSKTVSCRRPAWCLALLALATFVLPSEAFQPSGGGGRRRGGGPQKSNPPPSNQEPPRDTPSSGEGDGKIVKYELVSESKEGKDGKEDANLIGILSFKPQGKKSKIVRLQLIKEPEPVVDVPDAGNFKFDLERIPEVLVKGLYCHASWDLADPTEDKKPNAKKNLLKLSLTTMEVVGIIEEIQGDFIILKAKPKGERNWPDVDEKDLSAPTPPRSGKNAAHPPKPKSIPTRKLKLKIVDGVTRFTDTSNQPLEAGDFQAKQSVEAKIVYGRGDGTGIIVVLSAPNQKGKSDRSGEDKQASGRGSDRPKVAPPPGS